LIKTGETSQPGIDGALMEKSAGFPGIVNTIDVENLAESVKKVISNAGKQVGDIQNIPNVGIFSYCSDQEGNLFGLKQSIAE
jgi:predicted enzyme related to lactoylglutathione lyase